MLFIAIILRQYLVTEYGLFIFNCFMGKKYHERTTSPIVLGTKYKLKIKIVIGQESLEKVVVCDTQLQNNIVKIIYKC